MFNDYIYIMKCTADLANLKDQLSLIPLQSIPNDEIVSSEHMKGLKKILECYKIIIDQLYKINNLKWIGLKGIGLEELDEHMQLLISAQDYKTQQISFNDCHSYLLAGIQDAINTNA